MVRASSAACCFAVGFHELDSISPQLNADDLRRRTKVQSPIGLIAIPDSGGTKDAVFITAFFHPQKIPARPGRGVGELEVHAAQMARHQKFILAQLRDQHASDWLRVALRIPAVAEDGRAKGYDRLPPAQRERLLVLVLFLHGRLESPFKTQLRNLTH